MTAPTTRHIGIAPMQFTDATPDAVQTGAALLDECHALFRRGRVVEGTERVCNGLRELYDALPTAEWLAVADACVEHPLAALIHEDPFTYRAFAKPRGYPGDAATLDLMYGVTPPPPTTSAVGMGVYGCGMVSPATVSVRERREILADAIDAASARTAGAAHVLSVACGHLREAQRSAAVRAGAVASFHALDQDPISLALLREEHAPLGVTPVLGSVKDLLKRTVSYSGLTLAYAAGLYDYLPTPVAASLTARLFEMLAPGGRVLVANFCPELRDIGYMESFMAWRLIYRGEAEMQEIAAAIPGERVASQRTFRDSGGNVVYLEIERA